MGTGPGTKETHCLEMIMVIMRHHFLLGTHCTPQDTVCLPYLISFSPQGHLAGGNFHFREEGTEVP